MAKEKLMKGEMLSGDAPSAQKRLRKQVIDTGCIMLNIASTVTLIFLNKWYIYEYDRLVGLC